MINNKLLSIVVPVYNCEKYLDRCILSLLNQCLDVSQYEIILINDGSLDKSLDIITKYSSKNDNIIVINQKNSGVSASRNAGINKASGKYIVFVDADDMVYSEGFAFLIGQAEKLNADIILFNYKVCNENSGLEFFSQQKFAAIDCYPVSAGKIAPTNVWRELIKLSIIKNNKVNFVSDITMGEDHYFNEQLMCYVDESAVYYLNWPLYAYRMHADSSSQNNNKQTIIKKQNSMIKIARESREFINSTSLSKKDKKRLSECQYESVASALVYSLQLGGDNARRVKKALKEEDLYPYKLTTGFFKKKRSIAKYLNILCRVDVIFELIVMLIKQKDKRQRRK